MSNQLDQKTEPLNSPPNQGGDKTNISITSRVEKTMVSGCDVMSASLLFGLVCLLVFSILSRDVILIAVPWLEEIATLITIYAVAFASIGAWSRNNHIAIEILPFAMKGKWRLRYAIFLQLISVLFLLLAASGALEMMHRSANNRSTALGISFSYYYAGLLFAFSGMIVAAFFRLISLFTSQPGETKIIEGKM